MKVPAHCRSQRRWARGYLPIPAATRTHPSALALSVVPQESVRRCSTPRKIAFRLSFVSSHPLPKSTSDRNLRGIDALRVLGANVGTRLPNHDLSSHLRCASHRFLLGGQPP